MKKQLLSIILILSFFILPLAGQSLRINPPDRPVQVFFELETGLFGVNSHTFQSGINGTNFDFVTQGGQAVLYPFERYNAGMEISGKHRIALLYQPLTVNTDVTFREDVMIDSVTFSAGTPMELKYGFPFYRITYTYFFTNNDRWKIGAGGALQVRNASIVFKEINGEQMTVNQNVGPVPSINLYGKYTANSGMYISIDATGLYASSAIINGASFEFEGSILDASLRTGYPLLAGLDVFANIRFLGGTSKGTSGYTDRTWSESRQLYGTNYLATTAFTLGLSIY